MKAIVIILSVFTASSVMAGDLGFRYDKDKNQCCNQKNERGYNPALLDFDNRFAECSDLRPLGRIDKRSYTHFNFKGANLRGVNVQGATFPYAKFMGANLTQAILTGPDGRGGENVASFSKAFLPKTTFALAQGKKAGFVQAVLTDANFFSASLYAADFRNAHLHRATFDQSELVAANFSNAAMKEASLQRCRLHRSRFVDTQMPDVDLRKSILNDADFTKSYADRAKMSFTQCTHGIFHNAMFNDANFFKAKYLQPNFRNASLVRAKLDFVVFDMPSFYHANLAKASFVGARLLGKKGTLLGANLNGADLRNAYLKDIQVGSTTTFEGAKYNKNTTLPFSERSAKKRGMIFVAD